MYKINLWQCETSCFICRPINWHFNDISGLCAPVKLLKVRKKNKNRDFIKVIDFSHGKKMFAPRNVLKGTLYLAHLV